MWDKDTNVFRTMCLFVYRDSKTSLETNRSQSVKAAVAQTLCDAMP